MAVWPRTTSDLSTQSRDADQISQVSNEIAAAMPRATTLCMLVPPCVPPAAEAVPRWWPSELSSGGS